MNVLRMNIVNDLFFDSVKYICIAIIIQKYMKQEMEGYLSTVSCMHKFINGLVY